MELLIGFAVVLGFIMFLGIALIGYVCCIAAKQGDAGMEYLERNRK